jgi:hypothetical protein
MCSERRPTRSPAKATLDALVLALAFGLAGCGKTGPPQPPVRVIPAAVRDLTVLQRGGELVLEMGYPQTTAAGTPLPPLDAVEVWLARRPAIDGKAPQVRPAELVPDARQILTLTGADLGAALAGDRVLVRLRLDQLAPPVDPAAASAQALFFATRTHAEEGELSAYSNLAAVVPVPAPPRPASLTVTPEADAVVVSWPAVDGAAAGYRVYRRDAASRGYGVPLARVAPGSTSHRDTTARYGTRLIYAVTAAAGAEPVVESALSPEQEVAYEDRFAPPPPVEVLVLAERERVRLRWDASAATDVAGYLVWRREGAGEWRQITAEPLAGREMTDSGLASGLAVSYRVVAVDEAGNQSEPSPEAATVVP